MNKKSVNKDNILIILCTIFVMSRNLIQTITIIASIIPLLSFMLSESIIPTLSQEEDQPIEPIPPANITNQTSSQISTEIVGSLLIN
jgi:hypothetical protein